MNILVLSWRGPNHPNAGGAEQVTLEHAKGWMKTGHQVTLFTSYYLGAKEEEEIDGIKVMRRGRQIFGVQLEAFKWYLFENKQKFHLVVDEFHGIPFFTPLYMRIKKLAFIHEVTKEVWKLNSLPKPYNLLPSLLGFIIEPLIFKFLYFNVPFMTVSASTKEDLMTWSIPERNITVVHNGVNIINKPPKSPREKKKTLIYLGVISKDKGIEDALEVFSYIKNKREDFQFWVVGKSGIGYLKEIKKRANLLELKNYIKFWGFVKEDKKYELLKRAHILINTSAREGWSLVVIEAAAMGTPTVGYNVAGLRDSILDGKTGFLCDPDPRNCAEKILYLANNRETYHSFQRNCINRAKSFSWKKSVKESLDLIEKIAID